MKLELKHLSPYLPYNLKITAFDVKYTLKSISVFGVIEIAESLTTCFNISQVKPLLRPLSDLTKDENFDLYMDLCEEIGVVQCEHLLLALKDNLKYAFNLQNMNALEEFMNKNNFDWKYNLIDKGLAIDINTIT